MSDKKIIAVEEVMSSSVYTISSMATIREAVALIQDKGVSSLVVERRDERDEFGMLTIRDIARDVVAEDRPADRTSVYEVMQKPILTVRRDMNIKYAVALLTRFGVSRSVVVDQESTPIGIVTLRDMVLGSERILTEE